MSFLKIARTAVAASALAMLPVQAVAQTTEPVRAEAPMTGENAQHEGLGGYIIPIVIVLALGIGLYFAIRNDNNNSTSP